MPPLFISYSYFFLFTWTAKHLLEEKKQCISIYCPEIHQFKRKQTSILRFYVYLRALPKQKLLNCQESQYLYQYVIVWRRFGKIKLLHFTESHISWKQFSKFPKFWNLICFQMFRGKGYLDKGNEWIYLPEKPVNLTIQGWMEWPKTDRLYFWIHVIY